jgi:hypothetical protein
MRGQRVGGQASSLRRLLASQVQTAIAQVQSVLSATVLLRLQTALVHSWPLHVKAPGPLLAVLLALAPAGYDHAVALPALQLQQQQQLAGSGAAGAAAGAKTTRVPAADDLLSPAAFAELLERCVMPVLHRFVAAWDPSADAVPIQDWLLPWSHSSLLGAAGVARLMPALQAKFAGVLAGWHPADTSAHAMLAPWAAVWDCWSLELLLARTVTPKLAAVLRELPIHPGAQNLEPYRWVAAWFDVLPPAHSLSLLEGELLPHWFAALASWLASPGCDYAQVTEWYLGWKSQLPASLPLLPVLQAAATSDGSPTMTSQWTPYSPVACKQYSDTLKALLAKALDLMNDAVAGDLPMAPVPAFAPPGYAIPPAALQLDLPAAFARHGLPLPGTTSCSSLLEARRPSAMVARMAAHHHSGGAVDGAGADGARSSNVGLQFSGVGNHRAPAPSRRGPGVGSSQFSGNSALAALTADAAALLAARRTASSSSAQVDRSAPAASIDTAQVLSLKELLEQLAQRTGVQMLPHPRRLVVQGNPVFMFGSVPLFISGGVVHAVAPAAAAGSAEKTAAIADDFNGTGDKGSRYAPVSIDKLVEWARASDS